MELSFQIFLRCIANTDKQKNVEDNALLYITQQYLNFFSIYLTNKLQKLYTKLPKTKFHNNCGSYVFLSVVSKT